MLGVATCGSPLHESACARCWSPKSQMTFGFLLSVRGGPWAAAAADEERKLRRVIGARIVNEKGLLRLCENPSLAESSSSLAQYILDYCSQSEGALAYARSHIDRLVKTLEMTPRCVTDQDRALEMGAYLQMTPALHYRLGYKEVRGCDLGPLGQSVPKTVQSTTSEKFRCTVDLFDAEQDRFPYPDNHFQLVTCCEVLEHLNLDPMHMMAEINRVLKPDGYVILTTPNICSARAVAAVLAGYQPQHFSQYILAKGPSQEPEKGEGLLGRLGLRSAAKPAPVEPKHSREYAPVELPELLHDSGFECELLDTGPCGDRDLSEFDWVGPMLEKLGKPTQYRGEGIYARGRKIGPVLDRRPAWLYA